MTRILALFLAVGSALALSGCVAGMAVGAASMAVRSAQGKPQSNAHLGSAAARDCSGHASQYGTVHIIDVEQSSVNRLIVWGTVDDGKQKRSFECAYGTKITGFKLRAIRSGS